VGLGHCEDYAIVSTPTVGLTLFSLTERNLTMANDLVPLTPKEYPALDPGNPTLALLKENLGNEPISAAEFSQVKMPTSGSTSWIITSALGDQSEPKLEGVILHTSRRRAYWPSPDPTGELPQCASFDCQVGHGRPGGDCAACPCNQWGTAIKSGGGNGRGKACKEGRIVLFLRKGAALPLLLVVSPGSLAPMRNYLAQLAAAGCRYHEVVTELSLAPATNRDGIKYAKLAPRMLGRLDAKTTKVIAAIAEQYAATLAAFQIQAADVTGPETQEV